MSNSARKHWLWAAFGENAVLAYACLVHRAEPWAAIAEGHRRSKKNFGGTNVEVIQLLLNDNEANAIADAARVQAMLDLSQQGGPTIAFNGSRHRLTDSFGRNKRPTDTYLAASVISLSDDGWRDALDFMKGALGIDFHQTPDRLGAFDIYDLPSAGSDEPAVEFSAKPGTSTERPSIPTCFSLTKTDNTVEPMSIHVELELDGDPVFSGFSRLTSGESIDISAAPFDRYRMSVFDQSGALVQFEDYPLSLKIQFDMSAMGPSLHVDDTLSRSARGLGKEVQDQASTIRTRSTRRSVIGVENDAAFVRHRAQMRAMTRRLAHQTESDRWFPRGVAHEIGVIGHLNKMLDGARVSEGIIVDPFFGVDTLKRVIARLESLNVKLTVITSLISIDPETNQPNANLLTELEEALKEFESSGVPNAASRLQVVNLADGTRQAFHDRYLLITPHQGEQEIYILSNSLNKMAGNWPFCISQLKGAASRDAALYINGLVKGQDISGSSQPTTTFKWPPQ